MVSFYTRAAPNYNELIRILRKSPFRIVDYFIFRLKTIWSSEIVRLDWAGGAAFSAAFASAFRSGCLCRT